MTVPAPRAPRTWPATSARGTDAERNALVNAFAVSGLFWGAWASLLPALQSGLGIGDGRLGLALGVLAVAALPVMPLAGRLADRVGPGPALQWSLLLFAVVAPLPALVGGTAGFVLAMAVLGVVTGTQDVVMNAAAAAWERAERRSAGRVMALVHAANSFGVLVGSAAVGFAREAGATPLPVLLLVGGLTAAVAVRVPEHRSVAAGPDRGRPVRAWEGALLLVGLLVAGSLLVEDGLQSWSALHFERSLGAEPSVSGLGPAVFAGAMGLGRLASHALGRHVGEGLQLVGSGLLTAAGTLLLVLSDSPTPALVGLAIAGAGGSVVSPVLLAAVGRRSRAGRQGSDLALVSALGYLGFVAGPPLVGVLAAARSLPFALGVLGALGLAVGLVGPLAVRGRRRARAVRAGAPGAAAGTR